MSFGQALGLPDWEKPRVLPAVMTNGQRSVAQEDDLHCVRMTALQGSHVIMVAPMHRQGDAFGHLGHHLYPIQYMFHDPHPLTRGPFTDPLHPC